MPYIKNSEYRCKTIYKNGHISTIYCGAFTKTRPPNYQRMKLTTPDGDFLLIDYQLKSAKKAVILCHGLEGNSKSHYNNTCAEYFLKNGFSIFAWNNRSCGGEMNLLPKLYHHGSFEDLEFVVGSVAKWGFEEIYLIGFSLGGAQILNYLGHRVIPGCVKGAVAVSTPIELKSAGEKIDHGFSRLYSRLLVHKLKKKILLKAKWFPGLIDIGKAKHIRSFNDIACYFLLPVHRFINLEDYFLKASPGPALAGIQTPVLILNALDDPIIGKDAYPIAFAEKSKFVYLEIPPHGGHCAFPLPGAVSGYAEKRALDFFKEIYPQRF